MLLEKKRVFSSSFVGEYRISFSFIFDFESGQEMSVEMPENQTILKENQIATFFRGSQSIYYGGKNETEEIGCRNVELFMMQMRMLQSRIQNK